MTVILFSWILLFCFTSFSTSHYIKETTGSASSDMWDVDYGETKWYVLFVLASAALLIYSMMMLFTFVTIFASRLKLHKCTGRDELGDVYPGVSIVKPLKGEDSMLESNLESHFKLTYPKFELLLCFHDDKDPARSIVDRLHVKYPRVDVKFFYGGKKGIINPMVENMAPGYEAAKYEFIWISSSRIEASDEIIYDLASKLQQQNVSLVHQMPFVTDSHSFGSFVEKIYFGSSMCRFYVSFNMLGLCCVTGMSYMFKKTLLDQANGLAWFGKYLAEDFFLTRALHERGHIVLSAIPAKQNVGPTTVTAFIERMVRWVKLRLNMMTAVTAILEPLSDCFPLGIWTAWALHHFFLLNPFYFFGLHVLTWMVLDYIQLSRVQNAPLPFSKRKFIMAWFVREVTSTFIYVRAIVSPQKIEWGERTFRVKLGGLTDEITEKKELKS